MRKEYKMKILGWLKEAAYDYYYYKEADGFPPTVNYYDGRLSTLKQVLTMLSESEKEDKEIEKIVEEQKKEAKDAAFVFLRGTIKNK